jgi:hypothetical protein
VSRQIGAPELRVLAGGGAALFHLQALFGLTIAISGHAIALAKLDKTGGSNVFLLQRVEDLLLPRCRDMRLRQPKWLSPGVGRDGHVERWISVSVVVGFDRNSINTCTRLSVKIRPGYNLLFFEYFFCKIVPTAQLVQILGPSWPFPVPKETMASLQRPSI